MRFYLFSAALATPATTVRSEQRLLDHMDKLIDSGYGLLVSAQTFLADLNRDQYLEVSSDCALGLVFAGDFLVIAGWPLFHGEALRWCHENRFTRG